MLTFNGKYVFININKTEEDYAIVKEMSELG